MLQSNKFCKQKSTQNNKSFENGGWFDLNEEKNHVGFVKQNDLIPNSIQFNEINNKVSQFLINKEDDFFFILFDCF